jgi:outer membrane protein assembly factor BamA
VDTLVRRSAGDVWVTFAFNEGEPIVVDSLVVEGVEPMLDAAALRRDLPLRVGDPFDRFRFVAAADTIEMALRDAGHPWARVLRSFQDTLIAPGTRRARLLFEAIPGPAARVGAVEVTGLQAVDTAIVRRLVRPAVGEPFSQRALYASQRELYQLETFRFASVTLLDTVPPELTDGDSILSVRIGVSVTEGALRRIRLGAGYATLDCFRVQAGWTARNFLGGARTFDLGLRLSKIGVGEPFAFGWQSGLLCGELDGDFTAARTNYSLSAAVRQPWLLGTSLSTLVGLYAEERSEPRAYVRRAVGGGIGLTHRLGPRLPLTLSYDLSYGFTRADAATLCAQFNACVAEDVDLLTDPRRTGLIGLRLTYDGTDNLLNPSTGARHVLGIVHSSPAVASDSLIQFNRALGEVAFYYPVGQSAVFSWRLQAGLLFAKEFVVADSTVQFVPSDQRFYAGGANSVRGYSQNELGPVVYVQQIGVAQGDTTFGGTRVAPTGGSTLLVGNAELRVRSPVYPERTRLAFFLDAGQVWERGPGAAEAGAIRVTPGAGVRLATPVGPMRLDVAWNPYDRQRGPLYYQTATEIVLASPQFVLRRGSGLLNQLSVHFSVGQAF